MPLELRLVVLFVVGIVIGGQLNRAIYRLAYFRRDIGPWSRPHNDAPARHWVDLIPIVGWFSLRREGKIHGVTYWLRPAMLEFCCGIGLVWLYYWETEQAGPYAVPIGEPVVLHVQFLTHAILIALLIVATFIDFDEQTIPDSITVPGTLLALVLAVVLPASHLPIFVKPDSFEALKLTSPSGWPAWLNHTSGLWCGVACIVAWSLALLPKFWYPKRGLRKAIQFFFARIFSPPRKTRAPDFVPPRRPDPFELIVFATLFVGPLCVSWVWSLGGAAWTSLLTSLVGLTFGGGLIWAVRIIGTYSLGREAMGFGDVTLMAMIGAFFGWQPALIIFFLAPLAALAIALGQFLFTGRHELAFGPYLSLSAVILLVYWPRIWSWAEPIFAMGWLIPELVVVCLLLMFIMLLAMRWFKTKILKIDETAYVG